MLGGVIPDSLVSGFLDILRQSGPFGALLAAAVVVMTLSIIIFARTKGLWDDSKGRSQGIEFQARLLQMIDALQASEKALRERVEALSREKDAKAEEVDELRAGIAMLRNQRRRLIEMMRAGQSRPGKVPA